MYYFSLGWHIHWTCYVFMHWVERWPAVCAVTHFYICQTSIALHFYSLGCIVIVSHLYQHPQNTLCNVSFILIICHLHFFNWTQQQRLFDAPQACSSFVAALCAPIEKQWKKNSINLQHYGTSRNKFTFQLFILTNLNLVCPVTGGREGLLIFWKQHRRWVRKMRLQHESTLNEDWARCYPCL